MYIWFQIEIFWRIWLIRKVAMLGCAIILCYFAYNFKDFNVINNAILVQIQRQNQEMKHYLETIGNSFYGARNTETQSIPFSSLGVRGTDSVKLIKTDALPNHLRSIDTSDQTGVKNDSSDSEFSYDSDASDQTYIPNKDSSADEETFETAPSRPSSNVASPEISPIRNQVQKGTKKRSLMTPTTPSPYNLRSRASLARPFHSSVMPIPVTESPETFGRIIQKMERISKKNASKIIETLQNSIHTTSYYSSDDEWAVTWPWFIQKSTLLSTIVYPKFLNDIFKW